MKKLLLVFMILCGIQSLKAQLKVGLHGNFEFPLITTGGMRTPLTGPGLDLTYGILQEKIDVGISLQHRWTLNWPNNPEMTSYLAKFRYYFSPDEQHARFYTAIGFGYYKRKEEINFATDPVMMFEEDGAVLMPSIGYLLPIRFLNNTSFNLDAYYQYYSKKQRPSGIGVNVGLVHCFKKK